MVLNENCLKNDLMVYVVDKDYHLVQWNQMIEENFPDIKKGDLCYRMLCGVDAPCKDCPMRDKHELYLYNKKVKKWSITHCADFTFTEQKENNGCSIFLSRWVTDESQIINHFFGDCAENGWLLELNLAQDSYRTLYHDSLEYVLDTFAGQPHCLSNLLAYMGEHYIAASDRKRYQEFWDLQTLPQRLDDSWKPGILCSEVQQADTGSDVKWVKQFLMRMPPNIHGEYRLYAFVNCSTEKRLNQSVDDLLITRTVARLGVEPIIGLCRADLFFEMVDNHLKQHPHRRFCMLAVDIPQFWLYNSRYGYEAGDNLIFAVADALKEMQEHCCSIAGYLGMDDFALLLPYELDYVNQFYDILCRNMEKVSSGFPVFPKVSGYIIKGNERSANRIYDFAVNAWDKVGGTTEKIRWHEEEKQKDLEQKWDISRKFFPALQNKEFVFYLQPQVDLATGRIVGAEALVRWIHSKDKVVPPSVFLPALEKNGMITQLDCYLWEEVFRWLHERLENNQSVVPISLNISKRDIYAVDLDKLFTRFIQQYQVPKELIHLELTENIYMEDYDVCRQTVNRLRESGFKVLLDDFGSGQSSLHMLDKIDVDVLKLDMRFLDFLKERNGKPGVIMEMVLNMAKGLSLPVIAEGIETKDQLNILKQLDCQMGQGYYFYRPVAVEQFEQLL